MTAVLKRKKMTSRNYVSFPISSTQNIQFIKQQMLKWASPFNICCFLDNQGYTTSAGPAALHSVECLLAAGVHTSVTASAGTAFTQLQEWAADQKDWLFGHFAYDLARETEPPHGSVSGAVHTTLPDPIGFPDLFFFVPEVLIELSPDSIRIGSLAADPRSIWEAICAIDAVVMPIKAPLPSFIPRFTRDEYLDTIRSLQAHILRGDCYEINFCQEFYACPVRIDPEATWWALSKASPNPFSAFYRLNDSYLFCASPERYLRKSGSDLFSQPIKGTAPRDRHDPAADRLRGEALYNSSKDRSENVMVVDLVRNDLSRICEPGSVNVSELFGVYPFPHVHQMISTVTGRFLPGLHWTEAIRQTFPMGSMTGAPKNKVVGLIAGYERSRRGIFSGAIGYVTPEGDFDLNVVIRSLLYNCATQYLSYQVGSGITFYSDPQAEYEECMVKAQGIKKAFGTTN